MKSGQGALDGKRCWWNVSFVIQKEFGVAAHSLRDGIWASPQFRADRSARRPSLKKSSAMSSAMAFEFLGRLAPPGSVR